MNSNFTLKVLSIILTANLLMWITHSADKYVEGFSSGIILIVHLIITVVVLITIAFIIERRPDHDRIKQLWVKLL